MRIPPSMQDVATAAGVGKATVSLALRNDPRLRLETRERIQTIAQELGYQANATVANLMAQLRASRTPKYQASIALLHASRDIESTLRLNTLQKWMRGCHVRASQVGYGVDEFWLYDPQMSAGRLIKVLNTRGIRGVLVTAVYGRSRQLPEEHEEIWRKFACVAIGVRPISPRINSATNDQYSTALRSMEQLHALGYRRPGLALSCEVDATIDGRFSAGFWAGQQLFSASNRIPMHDFSPERETAFRKWLTKHRPDVIVCANVLLKGLLENMGLDIPGDIGLVHLDKGDYHNGWAGMDQNSQLIGAAAVDMVIGQLHRNEIGIPSFTKVAVVQSNWLPGSTVRQQRGGRRR